MMLRAAIYYIFLVTFSAAVAAAIIHNDDDNNSRDILIGSDYIIRKSHTQHSSLLPVSSHPSRRRLLNAGGLLTGRANFWDNAWPAIDSMKTQNNLWSPGSNGRPVLDENHILVLPVWWDGETQTSFDNNAINLMMQQTKDYYLGMSWMKHNITWEILSPTVLNGLTKDNAGLDNSEKAARDYINKTLNLAEFDDFTAITIVYTSPNEAVFNPNGGVASINGNFAWMSKKAGYFVYRHEIGHNYGHPHHLSNTYQWRFKRGKEQFGLLDGFDMMSGAASKWFYNWIPNDAIILMQPEGSTARCPSCVASVSNLVLKPFDDKNVLPSSENKMAVHIPISASADQYGQTIAYSYWLSYRGVSVDGKAAGGLVVQFSWFTLSEPFGASYDSLNYDANGDTDSLLDSFVTPGTCYLVTPTGLMMDADPASATQIQPIVCVDSVSPGISIKISISFLNPKSPPVSNVTLASQMQLGCSKSGTSSGDVELETLTGNGHIIQVKGAGSNGKIDVSLCRSSESSPNAKVYFYDSFPRAYMALGAPPAYGAFKGMDVTSLCSTLNQITYQSEYDETYILILRDKASSSSSTGSLRFKSTCTVAACTTNQYLDAASGKCLECPTGFVSPLNSLSINNCSPCGSDGLAIEHPRAPKCQLSQDYFPGRGIAKEWRLFTFASLVQPEGWWHWNVDFLSFYSSADCISASKIDTTKGTAISSGFNSNNTFWSPANAFDNNGQSIWLGASDSKKYYWIGMNFMTEVAVKCVKFSQEKTTIASELWLQAKPTGKTDWENIWIAKSLKDGVNTFSILSSPTPVPVPVPAIVPVPASANVPVPVSASVPVPVSASVPVPVSANVPVPVSANVPVPVSANVPVPVSANVPIPVSANVPIPAPVRMPVQAPASKPSCFSSVNTVEVRGAGHIQMSQLKIGDFVRSGNGKFTQVFGFGHLDHHVEADFIQIYFVDESENVSQLEVTSEHLLFVERKKRIIAVPASHIVVGDLLSGKKVASIHEMIRRGVYSPLTQSGDITVSGIRSSNYVNILKYNLIWDQHSMGHAIIFPQRTFCKYFIDTCKEETYTDGYGSVAYYIVHIGFRLNKQGWLARVFVSFFSVPVVVAVYALESVGFIEFVGTVIAGVIIMMVYRYIKRLK